MYMEKQPKEMTEELFSNPPSGYRAAPFWAWNCVITQDKIEKQTEIFREMGFGGFHIHCRTGMSTEYLGDTFMNHVAYADRLAKDKGLLCWLYDEDRYASGYGGGYVTKDIRFRERYLAVTPEPLKGSFCAGIEALRKASLRGEEMDGCFLGSYRITLKEGWLDNMEYYPGVQLEPGSEVWYIYLKISEKTSWWNNQSYVNTLDKHAIDRFIEVTHERYYEKFADSFGNDMPAVFTDEPQFAEKTYLNFPDERKVVTLPFTDDFPDTFREKCGLDFFAVLPDLIWERKDHSGYSARYAYHNHLTDRFVEAYAGNIGAWCETHGICLAGHMKGEETLESQTKFVGDCMRSLSCFHLPGHDVLCDQRDYATAKMAQSIARQYGRYGALSELYGVTNWDFDFRGHKMQGDWQAALGITVRVPHLTWMSMKGEAKRDYPASIGYQSPWYQKYRWIEDHFARVNTVLSRGRARVSIAVIHPIESYWLYFGVYEQTYQVRKELERYYRNITEWLLFDQLDFDFIDEALLEDEDSDNGFAAGVMRYDTILVPGCRTLRRRTVERLRRFAAKGGKVLLLGGMPEYLDGRLEPGMAEKLQGCRQIPFERGILRRELEGLRDVDVRMEDGSRADNIFYQLREEGCLRYLFLARACEQISHTFRDMVESRDYPYMEKITVRIRGTYQVEVMDTLTGKTKHHRCGYENGWTVIAWELSVHGSLLLRLSEGKDEQERAAGTGVQLKEIPGEVKGLPEPLSIVRMEPNVLLLDMAEHCLNEGEWQQEEEILRLDNRYRKLLGYPVKEEAGAQPWTWEEEPEKKDTLYLRFIVESEAVQEALLAVESPEEMSIYVNGNPVMREEDVGYFTDEAIRKLRIPTLRAGRNEILMEIPFGQTSNIEACYLLGDFDVEVNGRYKKLHPVREHYYFGDLTRQGMPFYGGTLRYLCDLESDGTDLELKIPYFTEPLLEVKADGRNVGIIAIAPYTVYLSGLEKGTHRIEITAYGNRYHTFGQLHNCDKDYSWVGSCAWRTTGDRFSYEYQLKPLGILNAPMVREYRFEGEKQ